MYEINWNLNLNSYIFIQENAFENDDAMSLSAIQNTLAMQQM